MVNNEWLTAFNDMVYGKRGDNMSYVNRRLEERLKDDEFAKAWEESAPIRVGFKRLSDSAVIPTKAHASDSGFDIVASEDVIIEPGETAVVPTGIAVELPAGYEATVRPRSGVTAKTKLRVQLGTIDNGYNGEIGVIVDNIRQQSKFVNTNGGIIRLSNYVVSYAYTLSGNDSELGYEVKYGAYLIRKGEKIAQLVVQPLPDVEAYEVDGDIAESERGADGFGSSGIREGD